MSLWQTLFILIVTAFVVWWLSAAYAHRQREESALYERARREGRAEAFEREGHDEEAAAELYARAAAYEERGFAAKKRANPGDYNDGTEDLARSVEPHQRAKAAEARAAAKREGASAHET